MPLEGPFGLFALSGLAFLVLGVGLVWSSLGKHGGLSRSEMLRVVFDDDSPMKRPEARGDRIKLRAGAFIVGFGLMNLLAAMTMGEQHELSVCVKMCRQEGHWGGKFGPSQREFDEKGNPLRGCFCTTPTGSIELMPQRIAPLPPAGAQ